jgi:anti-sigma regulatory factor (Ser/Thr protein kinase)
MLPSSDAPAHARRWVRETLDGSALSDQAVNDAVLMIDELVTNAVVHAGTPIVVVFEPTSSGYRCEVVDQHVDGPLPRLVDVTAGAGRGLRFVDFMATAWGVDRSERDTTVWVEVTVTE